jgi:hypothetical protein
VQRLDQLVTPGTARSVVAEPLYGTRLLWDGITRSGPLWEVEVNLRRDLAEAVRDLAWRRVFGLLDDAPRLINSAGLNDESWDTPLHYAARGGAGAAVVGELIERGAWRTVANADGNRPLDIAVKMGHLHLEEMLTPRCCQIVPAGVLCAIQNYFHRLIRKRASTWVRKYRLRLPDLGVNLEFPRQRFWFPVPGMYGGFVYWLAQGGHGTKFISESSIRVWGGSGQRHEITASGFTLVDEGWV